MSTQSSEDKRDLILGSTIQTTSNMSRLVNNATARDMQEQKQEIDREITQEITSFQKLVDQKEQVIRELEAQVRSREKVNAKRQHMYNHEVKDKLKKAEDKLRYARAKAQQRQDQWEQVKCEVEQAEQELAEMQAKLRAKKDANEERVNLMKQSRDEHEYQKGNAIALHEAKVKNTDSQLAQVNDQLQYIMENTCNAERAMNEMSLKQIGLDSTERDLKEIEKRIQMETTRLGKIKIDMEREA